MPEVGEVVRLKSGGPDMVITYIYQESEGSREKLAAMKGFGPGDLACEWQQVINEDNVRTKKESFKITTVVYADGRVISS